LNKKDYNLHLLNKLRVIFGFVLIIIANILNQVWVEQKSKDIYEASHKITTSNRVVDSKWQQYISTKHVVALIISTNDVRAKDLYKKFYNIELNTTSELINYLQHEKNKVIDDINAEYSLIYAQEQQLSDLRIEKDRLNNWSLLLNILGLILVLFRKIN
jgi:hypothetical protein